MRDGNYVNFEGWKKDHQFFLFCLDLWSDINAKDSRWPHVWLIGMLVRNFWCPMWRIYPLIAQGDEIIVLLWWRPCIALWRKHYIALLWRHCISLWWKHCITLQCRHCITLSRRHCSITRTLHCSMTKTLYCFAMKTLHFSMTKTSHYFAMKPLHCSRLCHLMKMTLNNPGRHRGHLRWWGVIRGKIWKW